jgi:hypothetical protein
MRCYYTSAKQKAPTMLVVAEHKTQWMCKRNKDDNRLAMGYHDLFSHLGRR